MAFITLFLGSLLLVSVQATFDFSNANLLPLHAAVKRSALSKRTPSISAVQHATLRYIDAATIGSLVHYTDVHVKSAVPFLVLEDHDHLTSHVKCGDSTISLTFRKDLEFVHVMGSFSTLNNSAIITSHHGCDEEGHRSPWLIDDVIVDDTTHSITLRVTPMLWSEAFNSTSIKSGQTAEEHIPRVSRRQVSTSTLGGKTSTRATTTTAADLDPGPFSSLHTPTAGPLERDLSSGPVLNSKWEVPVGESTLGFAMGCQNCTTTGKLGLSSTKIDVAFEKIGDGNSTNNIRGGEFTIDLKGFSAYLELWMEPRLSREIIIPMPIAQVLPVGYQIKGIGGAGVLFQPEFIFRGAIQGGIRMTYGVNVRIPDSQIVLDVSNLSNSSISGFEGTTVEAIPFQADIADLTLEFGIAFRPRLTVGFYADNGMSELRAEAGMYLEAPSASVSVSQLVAANYDGNCEPRAAADTDIFLAEAYSNLTLIQPSVNFRAGVDARFAFDMPGSRFDTQTGVSKDLYTASKALPTKCLIWQPTTAATPSVINGTTIAAPTAAFAEATAVAASLSASASAASASSSAAGVGAAGKAVRAPGLTGPFCIAAAVAVAASMVML